MHDDEDDPLPALRAEIDQMLMLAPELVRSARAWFDAFQGEGFSDEQALYLTAAQLTGKPGAPPN
jgi:hypothetical protein